MKTFMYYLALILGLPFALIFFKTKITYEGNKKFSIPKGSIIISNHKSFLDSIVIAYVFFFRRLYFLAADWYHGAKKIFKPFMSLLGCVLVDPLGRDQSFLKQAQKVISKNKSLLVFPEGDYLNNKHLFEFGEFKPGYLMIEKETNAPIVMVISDFSYGLFSRVRVKISKPIYLSINNLFQEGKKEIIALNEMILNKCKSLFYELKKEKSKKIKMTYEYKEPLKGDVIRINIGLYHHYGLYFDDNNVLEFGDPLNKNVEDNDIHLISLKEFSRGKNIEVRKVLSFRKIRKIQDIEAYSKEVIGLKNYSFQDNNCLDLVNRLTLKI